MQIIGGGESTPNADYREGRIYTKCRLSERANLHQLQIIGRSESTRNADYRKGLVPEGGGEGDTVLYRAAEGELVSVLEIVTDGDTAGEGADTEVGDLL